MQHSLFHSVQTVSQIQLNILIKGDSNPCAAELNKSKVKKDSNDTVESTKTLQEPIELLNFTRRSKIDSTYITCDILKKRRTCEVETYKCWKHSRHSLRKSILYKLYTYIRGILSCRSVNVLNRSRYRLPETWLGEE